MTAFQIDFTLCIERIQESKPMNKPKSFQGFWCDDINEILSYFPVPYFHLVVVKCWWIVNDLKVYDVNSYSIFFISTDRPNTDWLTYKYDTFL